ncbi:hypothetical protein FRX31_020340, partial [Thalictrum thalictroides]
MGDKESETYHHLFLHCEWVTELWGDILFPLGITAPNPFSATSIELWLANWLKVHTNALGNILWRLAPYAVLWVTWKARNEKVFKNVRKDTTQARMEVMGLLWYWVSNCEERRGVSFREMLLEWDENFVV